MSCSPSLSEEEGHRPSNATSQSSTIRDLPRDDDTITNFRDHYSIKEEEQDDTLSFNSQDTLGKYTNNLLQEQYDSFNDI
jgi:hypothetical protein